MNAPTYRPVTARIVDALVAICGAGHVISTDADALERYSHDQVPEAIYAHRPEVVVKPQSAREIAAVMDLACREAVPVTPRAAGSGLSGGAVPLFGGILLSVERMNRIIEIDRSNLIAVVEPGVVTNRLDAALRETGLFFAGYPMSEEFCFIGGNVAENAGGGRAIKYGVTGRYILGLEVVLPTGAIVQFGGKRVKDVTGYDMLKLMIGSEGTLGIFTKIFVKLLPRPNARQAVLALFADVPGAMATVPDVMTGGRLIPTAIEFMDRFSFCLAAEALGETFDCDRIGAALLFEVDGATAEVVASEAAAIRQVCQARGALADYTAETEDAVERFWKIRKRIPWVLKKHSPVQSIEDIVVPIAGIAQLLPEIERIGREYEVQVPVFGHAGDGNLHATPMKNPDHSVEHWRSILPQLLTEIYRVTARLGGTISGEHGIGHKRRDFLPLVMSPVQLELMRKIKQAFDPAAILNPGKIVSLD